MRKQLAALAALMFVMVLFVARAEYVMANSDSGIYHNPYCRTIKKPNHPHWVIFDTYKEAEDAGYRACKVCGG